MIPTGKKIGKKFLRRSMAEVFAFRERSKSRIKYWYKRIWISYPINFYAPLWSCFFAFLRTPMAQKTPLFAFLNNMEMQKIEKVKC